MTSRDVGFRVLFVCSGNTCRSPMAAGVLLAALGAEAGRVEVGSAGTVARDGDPATEPTIRVAGREGIDLRGHRARRVTPSLFQGVDLVLVMERSHRATLAEMGADPQRTFVLSEWPPPGEPELTVSDPFGGSIEAYEECWRRIRRHIGRVAPHVLEAARARPV